jgi:hypothetical protein
MAAAWKPWQQKGARMEAADVCRIETRSAAGIRNQKEGKKKKTKGAGMGRRK